MDDFLTKLYEDEMDKTASVAREDFMHTLPIEELEAILGIKKQAGFGDFLGTVKRNPNKQQVDKAFAAYKNATGKDPRSMTSAQINEYLDKTAVAGPSHPPLPDSASGAELDARMKAVGEQVNKAHLSAVPKRKDLTDPTISYQGEGKKQPEEHTDEALRVTKQAAAWADQMGRMLAKSAACKTSEGSSDRPLSGVVSRMRAGKKKQSMGDMAGTPEMETTAAAKAKIAARTLRVTRGAPEHIKQAAAMLAGRQIGGIR